jgi:hypothetical protein
VKAATLLLILLSNQGYWFGGRQATINIRAAARGGLPAAIIEWELRFDGVRIGGGKAAVLPDESTELHVTPPAVRVRVELHWDYRLLDRNSGRELEAGSVALNVFPDDLTTDLARRLGDKRLVVWDKPSGLPELLDHARVPFTRIDSSDRLQVMRPDVLLVGPSIIGDSPFDQAPLAGLAENGTSVMIFRQSRPASLAGYPLGRRDAIAALSWLSDHPLLNGFEPKDLESWTREERTLGIIQLPADEPALAIGFYPPEVAGSRPAPLDALLLTKSVGTGRLVLCQIPMGEWETDPRSQMLLRNSIDYLLTRPQPTPRPSQRPTTRPAPPREIPTIPLSPGDTP